MKYHTPRVRSRAVGSLSNSPAPDQKQTPVAIEAVEKLCNPKCCYKCSKVIASDVEFKGDIRSYCKVLLNLEGCCTHSLRYF